MRVLLLVALNHFILWLADHQRSRQFFVRDGTAWTHYSGCLLLARCNFIGLCMVLLLGYF